MKHSFSKATRVIAMYLLVNFLFTIIYPSVALALTNGPSSPEFSTFTPVSSTDMVSLFTGDFNYNLPVIEIPGPSNSGYALSLSYQSGSSMESEASWVGHGWTLSPGSINRNLRGFPDEYDGEEITYFNKARPVWTAASNISAGLEIFSNSTNSDISIASLSLGASNRINNYTGYQRSTSVGVSVFNGSAGIDATIDDDGVTYSAYVSPKILVNKVIDNSKKLSSKIKTYLKKGPYNKYYLPAQSPKPYLFAQTKGYSVGWNFSIGVRPSMCPIGFEGGKSGSLTIKYNKPKYTVKTYGYCNSKDYESNRSGDDRCLGDYYVEKDRPYNPQHLFIGLPFNNYDVYSVLGEGIGGGFRSYLDQVGSFAPDEIKSTVYSSHIGFEVSYGLNEGVGMTFGLGYQQTKIGEWDYYNSNKPLFSSDYSYRFNNDLGGYVDYSDGDTEVSRGSIHMTSQVVGFKGAKVSGYTGGNDFAKNNNGASSYISQDNEGFSIYNNEGSLYVYGEGVKVRNATNLSVDIKSKHTILNKYLAFRKLGLSSNDGKYEFNGLNSDEYRSVVGSIDNNSYISTYLLTKILSPDYVDYNENGAADYDDFGGWTKFNYRSVYGEDCEDGTWYRYRMPYNGLLYQKNSISDTKDDMGSVSTGEKEVKYLKSIETKTHVAYFVTNKSEDEAHPYLNGSDAVRYDGVGAKQLTSTATIDSASIMPGDTLCDFGTEKLQYLEKIVLYVKKNGSVDYSKPLKTVHFEYDYSLVPNVANNVNSNYNYENTKGGGDNSGKLTLKKVWMEYEGVVNAKISPYVFSYKYPSDFSNASKLEAYYNGKYDTERGDEEVIDYTELKDAYQNPAYEPYNLDPWGNIMPNGADRKSKDIPWIDQGAYVRDVIFDPAAYQLKSITLPSGGTILVQYEADDYAYVQNRDAMAMARVIDPDEVEFGSSVSSSDIASIKSKLSAGESYVIRLEDLGIDDTDEEQVAEIVDKINEHFGYDETNSSDTDSKSEKKIYYKFLYALTGSAVPSIESCKSDYITGYANFDGAQEVLLSDNSYGVLISLAEESASDGSYAIGPWKACYDFAVNQRYGKLSGSDCEEPIFEAVYDEQFESAVNDLNAGGTVKLAGLTIALLTELAIGVDAATYFTTSKTSVCQQYAADNSFFKLPTLHRKKGGGVRVKRLLLHDDGIEDGDEVVIGTNYRYVLEDGITSSGVATNEPGVAREENPLVGFLLQKGQSWYEKITSGKSKEQTEGPLGESILPAASVGYSRVISENIHSGNTGTGFAINDYYTTKDYYFDKYYTNLDDDDHEFDFKGKGSNRTSLSQETDKLSLPLLVVNYYADRCWQTQGFRFIQTNMNGQLRKVSNWNGTYSLCDDGSENLGNCFVVSSQSYDYYEPGEKLSMISLQNGELEEDKYVPGKEMDLAMESKKIKDVDLALNIEFDLSVGLNWLPPIFVSFFPTFSYTENLIASQSTTKLINYPAVVKKVTQYNNGITYSTENLSFNKSTGAPAVVKTNDSSDSHSYYTFNMPAEWFYTGMGQKAVDSDNTNQLSANAVTFSVYDEMPDSEWLTNPTQLISASIQTYANNWGDEYLDDSRIVEDYFDGNSNVSTTEMNKIYRPVKNYVYKTDLEHQDEGVYDKGFYDMGTSFDLSSLENNLTSSNWIRSSYVTKYSPNGEVIEELDPLDIPSAALYGSQYGYNVPVMVASNATYNSIVFKDFEDSSVGVETMAHSGSRSLKYSIGENLIESGEVETSDLTDGALFKCWISGGESQNLYLKVSSTDIAMNKVARVGEWSLYDVIIPSDQITSSFDISIEEDESTSSTTLYVDDVRLQPLKASANCFVYDDENLRLLAQFDDQHFATYYQYDREGKLVRKIIETEKGIRTVQENYYNVPKVTRE